MQSEGTFANRSAHEHTHTHLPAFRAISSEGPPRAAEAFRHERPSKAEDAHTENTEIQEDEGFIASATGGSSVGNQQRGPPTGLLHGGADLSADAETGKRQVPLCSPNAHMLFPPYHARLRPATVVSAHSKDVRGDCENERSSSHREAILGAQSRLYFERGLLKADVNSRLCRHTGLRRSSHTRTALLPSVSSTPI